MPGPQAAQNLQMPHPRDWQGGQMPDISPGGGGVAWAQLELTDKEHLGTGHYLSPGGGGVGVFFLSHRSIYLIPS